MSARREIIIAVSAVAVIGLIAYMASDNTNGSGMAEQSGIFGQTGWKEALADVAFIAGVGVVGVLL